MSKFITFCLLLIGIFGRAQSDSIPTKIHIPQDAENLERLREINRDVWTPFAEAYAANDAEKYLALHTPDFIRSTGGEWAAVRSLDDYSVQVRRNFQSNKENGRQARIAFVFFERSSNALMASERGIYRYTDVAKDGKGTHYYGKFHVFHRKINGKWKITVDYDSNEDGAIGEDDFRAGLAPEVFSK
jgi:ketosteroid isomerase-like protein